ncbi:MAG: asparagine synthase (glutamine-hydrolyzing) [Chloroflexi bacterium]|nr:MAG: asparagine synthase (glutamine-hydrolyzing) [Chloroflexota bacterium]
MCGIAGILAINGAQVPFEYIKVMTEAMAHRGPDDEGYVFFHRSQPVAWNFGGRATPEKVYTAQLPFTPIQIFDGRVPSGVIASLGHRRLSILDLSPAGHQPMCTEDGRFWIVYNGEIYNFKEIRQTLIECGEQFFSESDTEVVLKAYRRWGPEALVRFNGMWALAIWDNQEKELFCARDRIGIKPFYYYLTDEIFLFASDIKTLIASRLYTPEPDWEGVYHAMSFYCAPRPMTCFKGVRALEQAHWMMIDSQGTVHKQRYWQMPVGMIDYAKSEQQWIQELRYVLSVAVKRRLVADVPVGTFMSGGIDSTTITALAAIEHPGIKAFTLAFDNEVVELDELAQATATARMINVQHIVKKVLAENILQDLRVMVRGYEEPFHSLSPNLVISKLVAENNVTVILNGLGGDELFCGYGREMGVKRWQQLRPWHHLLALLPFSYGGLGRAKRRAQLKDIYEVYVYDFSVFSEIEKQALFNTTNTWNSFDRFKEIYHLDKLNFSDPFEALGYMDIVNYIGNHHVYRIDQFTMFYSIEGRFPFLDHELIELVCRMPSDLKVRNGVRKYILRQMAKDLIHPSCLQMPKKGFGLPMDHWMRSTLQHLVDEKLKRLQKRDMFNPDVIDQIKIKFNNNRINYARVWLLVSLELWLEEFFETGML